MTGAIITVSPSREPDGRSAHSSRGPLFDGAVDGRTVVTRSVQPFLDGARALLADGMVPCARLMMRHAGSEVDALASTAGHAAGLTVRESEDAPRFRRHESAADIASRMGGLPRREVPLSESHPREVA